MGLPLFSVLEDVDDPMIQGPGSMLAHNTAPVKHPYEAFDGSLVVGCGTRLKVRYAPFLYLEVLH